MVWRALKNPVTYAAVLVAAYLFFGGGGARSQAAGGVMAPFGAWEVCAQGTCLFEQAAICNIGGGDEKDYCRDGDDGCGL